MRCSDNSAQQTCCAHWLQIPQVEVPPEGSVGDSRELTSAVVICVVIFITVSKRLLRS